MSPRRRSRRPSSAPLRPEETRHLVRREWAPMRTVLVVDDEPQIRRALAVNLTARGYTVHEAATGREALRTASANHPDAVVLDLGLPDIDGIDVVRGLR